MSTSGPLVIKTRQEMRAYLGRTLEGKRYGWGHLALKHNSVARAAPCRFCEAAARPAEGPAAFWDGDPICPTCLAEIAPELTLYLTALQGAIRLAGGNWRALGPQAA